MCEDLTSNYFDISRHIVIKRFPDKTMVGASLKRPNKFKTEFLNPFPAKLVSSYTRGLTKKSKLQNDSSPSQNLWTILKLMF